MTRLTRRTALTLMGSALAMPHIARAQSGALNVYNWADYIGPDTVAQFSEKTGIAVAYDNFSSVEEAEAKVLTGGTGYDLVLTSSSSLPRLIEAGVFQPLDRAQLPSWGNFDPAILELTAGWDAGNTYALPYTWGTTGIAYNVAMVKERLPDVDLTTADLLFKSENAAKLADCGITFLDSPLDNLRLGLRYLGLDGNDMSDAAVDQFADLMLSVRPSIRNFDNTNVINALANNDICAATIWSGDFAVARTRAAEAGSGAELAYIVPATGAPIWVDAFCIPSDAPNAANAHAFLEFLLQPQIIADMTNHVTYANANAASKPLIAPEILADPAIYPDPSVVARLFPATAADDAQLRAITRAWRRVRAG